MDIIFYIVFEGYLSASSLSETVGKSFILTTVSNESFSKGKFSHSPTTNVAF